MQLIFSLFFIAILTYYIYINKLSKNFTLVFLLSLTVLAIGIIRHQFLLNLFQILLVSSNFIFIFFIHKLNDENIRRLLLLFVILCFLQLFFDLIFPRDTIDPKDRYSGTFLMANNKGRFLLFILPLILFLPKKFFKSSYFIKTIVVISIIISSYLGYSKLGVLLFFTSIFLASFIKNIYFILIIFLASLYVVPAKVDKYIQRNAKKHKSHVEMEYERFFHEEHGVKAIYIYGFEELKKSYFIGVGYGNFSSRAGQLFNSEITKNIPKQLIKYWSPLFDTKAPYGLSSLYVLIIELGIFSLLPIFILLNWMQQIISNSKYHVRIMVIYLFFIINYNPTFFEFNESLLYFLIILIAYYYQFSNIKGRLVLF